MARETADVVTSASRLELMRVETEAGRFLGHVFDLRCQWQPGDRHSPLTEIIYGRLGFLERIGLSKRRPDSVPWSAVKTVRTRTIVVGNEAARSRRTR